MFMAYAAEMNGLIERQRGPNYKFLVVDEKMSGNRILWEQATHSLMFSGEKMVGVWEYSLSSKNELKFLQTIVVPAENLEGFIEIEVKNPILVSRK